MFVMIDDPVDKFAINLSGVGVIGIEYNEGGWNRVQLDGQTVFESKDPAESEKYIKGLMRFLPSLETEQIMAMADIEEGKEWVKDYSTT